MIGEVNMGEVPEFDHLRRVLSNKGRLEGEVRERAVNDEHV